MRRAAAGWCMPCGVAHGALQGAWCTAWYIARCIAWCIARCIARCIAWTLHGELHGAPHGAPHPMVHPRCTPWCVPWCVTHLRRDEWQQVGAVEAVRRVAAPAGLVAPAVEAAVIRDAHIHRVVEAHLRVCERGCRGGVRVCEGTGGCKGVCTGCKGVGGMRGVCEVCVHGCEGCVHGCGGGRMGVRVGAWRRRGAHRHTLGDET